MATLELIKAVAATAELCGAKLSEAAAEMLVRDLSAYPEQQVLVALTRVRKAGKRFSIGAVIEAIDQRDGRPGADEAWAMLPRTEDDTAVMTPEMHRALGVAQALLDDGDRFGARRAFVEAYERIVEEARERGEPANWTVSLGHDPKGREAVVRQAVEKGYLPASQLQTLLPAPDLTQSPIAGLLGLSGGAVQFERTDDEIQRVNKHLAEVKAVLKGASRKKLSEFEEQ